MIAKNYSVLTSIVLLTFSCFYKSASNIDTDTDDQKPNFSMDEDLPEGSLRLTSSNMTWIKQINTTTGCECNTYPDIGTGTPTAGNWACSLFGKQYDSLAEVPFECGSTWSKQFCKFSNTGTESCVAPTGIIEQYDAVARTDYCPSHPSDPACTEDSPSVGGAGSDSGDDSGSGDPDDSGSGDSGSGDSSGDPTPKGGKCNGGASPSTGISGSKIECLDRSVSQLLSIMGTPYSLHYSSRNSSGGSYPDRIVAKSIRQFYPRTEYGKILKVNFTTKIAGKTYTKSIPINRNFILESDNVSQRVAWDGLDANGQRVRGSVLGTMRIAIKTEANPNGDGHGTIAKTLRFVMNNGSHIDRFNLGGWSISHYHSFDSDTNTIFTGFGARMPIPNLNSTPIWKSDGDGNIYVPSSSASEIFLFSPQGLHLKTFDAITNVVLYTFQHDTLNRLIGISDKYGKVTNIQRSETGAISCIQSPYGEQTKIVTNESGYIASIEDPAGSVTRFTYGTSSALGLMYSYTYPNGVTKSYAYSGLGYLKQTIDPRSSIREFSSNNSANTFSNTNRYMEEIQVKTPLNRSVFFQTVPNHDGSIDTIVRHSLNDPGDTLRTSASGKQQISQSRDGTQTTMSYKSKPMFPQRMFLSNSVEKTPLGLTSEVSVSESVSYENASNPLTLNTFVRSVNQVGFGIWKTKFSKVDMNYTNISPTGRKRVTTLNDKGEPVRITFGGLAPTTFLYNDQGQVTSVSRGVRTYSFTYDSKGLLTSIIDPLGQTTKFGFDIDRRLINKILPNSQAVRMQYDLNGNTKSIVVPTEKPYSYSYDEKNFLRNLSEPALSGQSSDWSWEYSLDDKPIKVNQPDGTFLEMIYDGSLNKLNSMVGKNLTLNVQYDGSERRLVASNGITSINYEYDGSILLGKTWSGGVQGGVGFSWGPHHVLSGISINGEPKIRYSYNEEGEIVGMNEMSIVRSPESGLILSTTVGVVTSTWTYNNFGEVIGTSSSINGTSLSSQSYSRDTLGRIVSIQNSESIGTQTRKFTFDAVGQLLSEKLNGALSASYSYDSNGNRFAKNKVEQYDSHDRLASSKDWTYIYDANGTLAERRRTTNNQRISFTYDALGNLLTVADSLGSKVEYGIDAENHRVIRRVNGAFKEGFLYQDTLRPIAQISEDGSAVSIFVYGTKYNSPDLIVKDGVSYRVIHDQVGSPVFVVNSQTGDVVQKITYDTWGKVLSDTNPGFQPFGFAGGIYDVTTGLVRFGARDYDPEIGRWLNKDPIRFDGGWNLYAYSGNDPINFIDPTGLARGDLWDPRTYTEPAKEAAAGAGEFWKNYQNMRDANTIGADKFFHCMANCEAAQHGPGGLGAAKVISEGRELSDEFLKGDSSEACNADRAANRQGQSGAGGGSCRETCGGLRPSGLSPMW